MVHAHAMVKKSWLPLPIVATSRMAHPILRSCSQMFCQPSCDAVKRNTASPRAARSKLDFLIPVGRRAEMADASLNADIDAEPYLRSRFTLAAKRSSLATENSQEEVGGGFARCRVLSRDEQPRALNVRLEVGAGFEIRSQLAKARFEEEGNLIVQLDCALFRICKACHSLASNQKRTCRIDSGHHAAGA